MAAGTHYQTGIRLQFDEGDMMLLQPQGTPVLEELERTVVKQGDTMYKLAYAYYSEATSDPGPYWALIALANPHIPNPLELPEGETLVIPRFQKWPIARA